MARKDDFALIRCKQNMTVVLIKERMLVMPKIGFSSCMKTLTLIIILFLFLGCEGSTGIFIYNMADDNFRVGGPNGNHVKPGEEKFLTTLTPTNSSYSVELWRSYGCVAVLNVNAIVEEGKFHSATVTIHEADSPPFMASVNSASISASTAHCP